jgi:tRNA modification GTPase
MFESVLHEEATIVAPATPFGTGAVSIVRLSGPQAFPVAARLAGLEPGTLPPRTLVRCVVRDGSGDEIDTGLLAVFPAPHSYTGEDIAEIHLHGNPLLVERTAAAACALGAVPAAPGEFSRRAFRNGKMDLTQAEGLDDLIAARTEASARAALRQLRGGIGKAVGPLREHLFDLLIVLEASIDFADEEDVPAIGGDALVGRLAVMRSGISRLIASYALGHRLRDGATVAIAGAANVGKSLLLNRILGEDRAIVTEVPGTTRDYLSAEIVLSGISIRVIDTAGLRETEDIVEKEGVRRSREIVASADLVLFVLDGSRDAREEDDAAYGEVEGRPHLVVMNKADLVHRGDGARFRGEGFRTALRLSAKTGAGFEALLTRMASEVVPEPGAASEVPLTRLRHVEAARRGGEALARAEEAAEKGMSLEFVAADVREAAQALAELMGEIAPEEVLDAIFGSFCIGK